MEKKTSKELYKEYKESKNKIKNIESKIKQRLNNLIKNTDKKIYTDVYLDNKFFIDSIITNPHTIEKYDYEFIFNISMKIENKINNMNNQLDLFL